MKNVLIIILSVVYTSCNAQKLKSIKTFDIETFNKKKNHLNEYNYITKDSTFIEQTELEMVYTEDIKVKDVLFIRKNQYYKNGNLKTSGLYFDASFQKGIWKEYNEQGKLIKETDYDEGYKYSWEDLLQFLKKREVNIRDANNTTITKENGNWRFDYIDGIYIFDVIIDGKTGEILQDAKNVFEEGP